MIYPHVLSFLFVLFFFGHVPSFTSAKILTMSKFPQGIMMKCTKEGQLMKSVDDGFTWNEISVSLSSEVAGSSPAPAFFTSIASDATGAHLIASSKNQGVFISHDAGSNWQLVSGLDGSLSWSGVSSDAIGENLAAVAPNGGVYFSNDHGRSWKESPSAPKVNVWRSIVSDRTGQYLTATSENDGIYTSFDYGVNWVKAQTPMHVKKWNDIAVDFSGQYLAAIAPSHGIFHSMDHGLTWAALSLGESLSSQEWKSIASDRTGQFLAAVTMEGKIYVSGDYGHHWKQASNFPLEEGLSQIVFDADGTHLFALTEKEEAVYYSSNKGTSWSTRYQKVDSHSMEEKAAKPAAEAFNALFHGYKDFVPKINKEAAVKGDSNGEFKELFENYQVNLAAGLQSSSPTSQPSGRPSGEPSGVPSSQPSSKPSGEPSSQPSSKPSVVPTLDPTTTPSSQPSSQPSAQPFLLPTSQPTSVPSKANFTIDGTFTLTQILNGVSEAQFADAAAIAKYKEVLTSYVIANPDYVNEVIGVTIISPFSAASISVSADSVTVVSKVQVIFSKWHYYKVASYNAIQQTINNNIANGNMANDLKTSGIAAFADLTSVTATFGIIDVTGFNSPSPSFQPTGQPSSQPSGAPSSQPSGEPTSKPSEDYTLKIPKVDLSLSSSTVSTLTVDATFTTEIEIRYSGNVYCAAFSDPTSVTSANYISTMILNGRKTPFPAGATSLSVTLEGLIPITQYTVYCMVENIIGRDTSFSEMTTKALTANTACCKTISFTTAPSFLFNFFTLYSLPANVGKNVFTFRLAFLPATGKSLTLTPTFSTIFNSSNVRISPSSFTFTSASNSLVASFSVLTFNNTLSTTGTSITLVKSGSGKDDFNDVSTPVVIVSSSRLPAPTMVSATIGDDGSTLSIAFSGNTDYGGKAAATSFACSDLFTFSYFTVTGTTDTTRCVWTTGLTVVASFSTGILPAIFVDTTDTLNKVNLIAGKVRSLCTTPDCVSFAAAAATLPMSPPINPVSPNVVVNVPATLSGCSNLSIDATASTGNLGRKWKTVKFSVTSANVPVDGINDILSTFDDTINVITISSTKIASTTYFLTVSLTNAFGRTSSVTVSFEKSANTNIPTASIGGATTIITKAQSALSFTGSGSLSSCGVAGSRLTYAWRSLDSSGAVVPVTSSSNPAATTTYQPVPYSFQSGQIYTVQLTVTSSDGNAVNTASATASVTVQVRAGDVVASIAGSRSLLVSQNVTLDASSSYDEDVAPGGASSLAFQWSCVSNDATTFGEDCTATALAGTTLNQATLKVNYANLEPSRSYSLVVLVSSGSRRATTSVTLNTVAFSSSEIQINAAAAISTSQSTVTTVNQFQSLSIAALITSEAKSAVTAPLFAKWSGYFTDETDTFDLQSFSSLPSVNASLSLDKPLVNYAFPLTIKASSFEAGSQVTFRLTLSFQNNALAFNEITYNVVKNPSGGSLTVSPAEGTTLSTIFTIRTLGWVDDASNLPLSYDFTYVLNGATSTLQTAGPTNFVRSALPAGTDSSGGLVILQTRVYNVFGGYSTTVTTVKVNVAQASSGSAASAAAADFLKNSLAAALDSGNTAALVAAMSVGGSALNTVDCSNAPNSFCTGLNRRPCAATPQTCGRCLSGFSGIFGDSNARCVPRRRNGGRRALWAFEDDLVWSVAETACASDDDCLYGTCNLNTGFCVVPPKECVNQCSGNGVCAYKNINGNAMNRTDCAVDNTFCTATCTCKTGFYGIDCSLTEEDYRQREESRSLMCSTLASVIQSSNPSTNLLDSMASSLSNAYNPYEVLTPVGRADCLALLESIIGLAQDGYLTTEQLPNEEETTAVQNVMNVMSDIIKVGSTAELSSAVTSFTTAVMSLLASGQSDVQLLSDNLKLSFNKIRFSEVIGNDFVIPLSNSESNYGTVTPTISFTNNDPNEIINSCSFFNSPDPTKLGTAINNPNNYFTFAYGSWNVNPFADVSDFETVVVRAQAYTNNTVTTKAKYDVPLYYITYPFTSAQHFMNFSRMSKEERSLYNQTFPVCSEYFLSNSGQNYVPSICSSCNVSTYDNTSVTFVCYNMESFCGKPHAREIDGAITTINSDRRYLAASSNDNVYQVGAFLSSVSASSVEYTFNSFKVNVNEAIPILISVGGIVLLILIGLVYFYQWDINDYHIVKYSNRIKYNYTSMFFETSPVGATRAAEILSETDDDKDGVDQIGGKKMTYGSMLKSGGIAEKLQSIMPGGSAGDSKAVGSSSSDILYILHNAFPAVVYQQNPADEGDQRNSTASNKSNKSFYDALTKNDYMNMFNSENYYYHRFIKFVQVMIQVITILFINTLFFYIFYPDRGQCEDYKTEGDCSYHKNLITQDYLCKWSSTGIRYKEVTCELRPPELSVPFIMLLSTVTILIAMPLVIGWNVLFMDICASIPPAWYKFFIGDTEPEQVQAVSAGEEREEEEEDVGAHAEQSGDRYVISHHAQRISRKPLPVGARAKNGPRAAGEEKGEEVAEISPELFYVNRIPVEEEMDVLFQAIQRFYHQLDHHYSAAHPVHHNYHGFLSPIQAKMLYIYYSIGIDSNFHTVPLSLRQQLKYGRLFTSASDYTVRYRNVYSNPQSLGAAAGGSGANLDMTIHHAAYQRIRSKLNQSRLESEEFIRFFEQQRKRNSSLQAKDPVTERDAVMMNNIQLLQFFVFEQFPVYQKYLLYYFFHHTYLYSNLHLFNSMPTDQKASHNSVLNMIAWVLKSLVLLGGIAFSVYFILNWSVVSQGNTFASWGINYIIIVVEQLFIIQLIQFFYVQNIIYSLLLPKLQVIYAMIYQKLVQIASVPVPDRGSVILNNKGLRSAMPSNYSLGLSSAWPGMSYYSTGTGLKEDGAGTSFSHAGEAATGLGWKDEFPVSQLLSPVARACKTSVLSKNLVISRMINSLTDSDMVNLKSQLSDLSTQYSIESSKSFWSRGRPLSSAASEAGEGNNNSESNTNAYYKEVSEWKQYSLFHLLCIMLPLFIIQGTFQALFSVLPLLSSSFYSKNFVLNSFHMVYFNMLFSYIMPGLISLLVVVCYYFCINAPLPAFIITVVVVLFLVFYITPKRNEQFWQSIVNGYGSTAGHRQRRFGSRGPSNLGFSISSLREFFFVYVPYGLGRVVGFILSPFVRQPSRSQFLADQQWQRQNIPMSLQSVVLPPSDNTTQGEPSAPVYDSYLMTLLASHHHTATSDGSKSLVPNEIQQITAVSSFQQSLNSDKRIPANARPAPSKEFYLSSLLDQTYYDGKQYEDYILSRYKTRKEEDIGKRISSTNYTSLSSRTTPLTDGGNNDHVIVVDGTGTPIGVNDQQAQQIRRAPVPLVLPPAAEGEESLDPRTVYVTTIATVRQLRYLTEHMIRSGGLGGGAGNATNHRYYNLYHKATDDVQIALLRAVAIYYLHSSEAVADPNLLNNLNHIYTLSEQIFSQPLGETALPTSNATVDANECNEIMQQFFSFYVPIMATGATLSATERTEIVNDFYQFIIMNDYSWEGISFPAFIQWFRLMMDKIVKYKAILQYGSGSSASGNSQGSGNTGTVEKAGSGSSNGSDDGSGSGSNGSKGKYQYQMNYQRLQRTVMTDPTSLTVNASTDEDDVSASVLSISTPVIRAGRHTQQGSPTHTTPQVASSATGAGNFSTPRRLSALGGTTTNTSGGAAAPRPIAVQTSANPDNFNEANPLRGQKAPAKASVDLSKQLENANK